MTGSSQSTRRTQRRRGPAPARRPATFVAVQPPGVTIEPAVGARETMAYQIIAQRPQDVPLLDPLLDRTFGADRRKKTVYRLRENAAPVPELCFSAVGETGALLGSLRFWPVRIGNTEAILLGPLAVEPALQGIGIGRNLVRHGLERARVLGHSICVVVGEPDYYQPFGFTNAGAAGLSMPGPVEAPMFQVLELIAGALETVSGVVGRADERRIETVSGHRIRQVSTARRSPY